MKTAIGYIRVSTEEQATEGVSLAAQEARIKAYCLANDLDLASVYVDAGLSGKRADNRPQLQAALDHVCRTGGVLIVYSLSRLARSTTDTIAIGERLAKHDADLVSLSEKIDTTSAAGRMIFKMFAVFAEFEREQLSERVTMAMKHKKKLGERVGAIPFGFSLAADGIQLVKNADEQKALDLVRQLRDAGESMREIAAELTRRRIATKEGNSTWNHSSVQRILERKSA